MEDIRDVIYDFFVSSRDFNGIPLRNVSEELNIDYIESIEIIKTLVVDDVVTIQSGTNPHIIGISHIPVDAQLALLDEAKDSKEEVENLGEISISFESGPPICLYPSQTYVKSKRNLSSYNSAEYSKQLAICEPQLSPRFFEIEILDRYFSDPRFDFDFKDYSGQITCKHDDNHKPVVREEDEIFLKSFGLGFDSNGNRLVVVYLRYLNGLTSEHQLIWKSKEVTDDCKMLQEYYDNTIKGEWSFSHSVFSAFLMEMKCLTELSNKIFGTRLFNNSFEDEARPKEFTFFFTPTSKNYYDFVLLLDKMISHNINKKFFKGRVELYEMSPMENNIVERKQKGTIRLLEEWLLRTYDHPDPQVLKDIFKSFKAVRNERQAPAHKIDENVYDKELVNRQMQLVSDCYSSLRALRTIFQQHPKAIGYEIPDWLDNGDIKSF